MGTEISPGDLGLHRAMAEWNESPIYLLLVRTAWLALVRHGRLLAWGGLYWRRPC